jgi:glycosyltransferase involved in cell wall biosynthesis
LPTNGDDVTSSALLPELDRLVQEIEGTLLKDHMELWTAGARPSGDRQAAYGGTEVARGADRRILVVAPQPFYQDRGTPIALRQVLEALSQLGYGVDLLTFPQGENIALPGLRIFRAGNPVGIRAVPIGFSLRKVALDASLVAALNTRLSRDSYTCVHAVEEAAFPAVVMGRRRGIPTLYDMQSSLPEQLLKHSVARIPPVPAALGAAERWLLNRADLVVASVGLADRVRRVAPGTRAREWRFPSATVGDHTAEAEGLRRRLGLSDSAPVVLYSGTFEAYQGLEQLIAAAPRILERVPSARFVLVGADEAGRVEVETAAAELVRDGILTIVDRQPRSVIPGYLALADVLVSPRSFGGNLPLKVFDYLAAGRPIVATDIPTHRELLTDERAVLVAPTGEGLAAGIVSVLCDVEKSTALAEAAREYAVEHLGWGRFRQSVAEIYQEAHCPTA